MEHAVLHLHQPVEFQLADGSRFEASRIAVLEKTNPESHVIRVYGVLHDAHLGLRARVLVIHPEQPVDLTHDLRATVARELTAGNFQIL